MRNFSQCRSFFVCPLILFDILRQNREQVGILVFSQPGALSGAQLEQVVKGVEELDMDEVRSQIAAQQQGAQGQQDAAPQA